jgi:hypothetical protein
MLNKQDVMPVRKTKKLIVAWILLTITAMGALGHIGTTKQPFGGLTTLLNCLLNGQYLKSYYLMLELYSATFLLAMSSIVLAFYDLKKHKNKNAIKIIIIGFVIIALTIILY